ncbi:MAG: hypothetical protein WCE95_08245, partial [Nitrososphaeraceae archaeon]
MAIEEPIEADEAIIESASESISETKKVQEPAEKYKVRIEKVNGWYGAKRAIKDVNLNVKDNAVTAFIGPSGCG